MINIEHEKEVELLNNRYNQLTLEKTQYEKQLDIVEENMIKIEGIVQYLSELNNEQKVKQDEVRTGNSEGDMQSS